jgi:hypothetical protein
MKPASLIMLHPPQDVKLGMLSWHDYATTLSYSFSSDSSVRTIARMAE